MRMAAGQPGSPLGARAHVKAVPGHTLERPCEGLPAHAKLGLL